MELHLSCTNPLIYPWPSPESPQNPIWCNCSSMPWIPACCIHFFIYRLIDWTTNSLIPWAVAAMYCMSGMAMFTHHMSEVMLHTTFMIKYTNWGLLFEYVILTGIDEVVKHGLQKCWRFLVFNEHIVYVYSISRDLQGWNMALKSELNSRFDSHLIPKVMIIVIDSYLPCHLFRSIINS